MANWGMIGEALGAALANNYVRRGYNKDIVKAQTAVDTIGNPNTEDNASAYEQVLKQKGLADAIGKDPRQYVEQMKNNYAMAENSGDTAAMNTSHAQAERMREVAQALRMNMDGFGADDSLENVRGLLGKAVNPRTPTSNDIGKGLSLLGDSPTSTQNRFGLDINTSFESEANPAFTEKVREMLSPSGESEFERNIKSLVKSGNTSANPAYFAMENKNVIPNETITADKIKSVYGDEIQGIAEQLAANRTKNPWEINRLENKLIGQGVNPDAVRSVLKQQRQKMITEMVRENLANGNYSEAFINGLTALANGDKSTAQAIFTGIPTPKEGWNVNNAREDAATAQGYRRDNLGLAHELSEDTAKNNVGRRKDLAGYMAQLNLQTQNMGREQAFDFTYDKLVAAKVDPREAARLAAGIKPSSNSNSAQQQQYKKASDYVKMYQSAHKNDLDDDWKKDETYQTAMAIMKASLMPGEMEGGNGGNNGISMDANGRIKVYKDAIGYATDILEQNQAQGNKHSKETMINLIRARTGDMADNIINSIDWKRWGYGVVPERPEQYGNGGD